MVNAGVAVLQPHIHGNRVRVLTRNGKRLGQSAPEATADGLIDFQIWKDVIGMPPLTRKDVMLPLKFPPDASLVSQRCKWVYPMHCHVEMSQTAGGGLYPNGMLTDWELLP